MRAVTLAATTAILLALGFVVTLGAAGAPPDRQGRVTPSHPYSWTGDLATGTNTGYNSGSGTPCNDSTTAPPSQRCDKTLLNVDVRKGYWKSHEGGVDVTIDNYQPNPASDFDLYVYKSDAQGSRGKLVTSSAGLPGANETARIDEARGYYLVQVVYFAVTASRYSGEAEVVLQNLRDKPPDVDRPRGVRDQLASDPSLGYRSHSEPHIAQSPVDSKLLIAGSKEYNRDPDSLDEYEFKIGSQVSFNGGRSWTDLGQINTCRRSEAPPSSWPNNHCYPRDNPRQDGTGEEDEGGGKLGELNPGEEAGPGVPGVEPQQRGSDYGEEYITSDIWMQQDDEGNAFAMVLDSPPYQGGQGFGMSLHRWTSVSKRDVRTGHTWSNRIPINKYNNEIAQQNLLDDKNTLAVNNAGPDKDGKTGTIVACWGQNVTTLIKQQTVCESSINEGRSFPRGPFPISDVEQLVIGVHVVADEQDPNKFYAVWLQYASGIVGPSTYEFAELRVSPSNGNIAITKRTTVGPVNDIPRTFPGQSFRNLSIPIMATSPSGDLYLVYSEYRPAPNPATDEDDMQADIILQKSTNGGLTWGPKVKVNQDHGNADQFQPYVEATQAGQVNVSYFDRRKDHRVVKNGRVRHTGNFFIDTYLSRSSDGGSTFKDQRVSHDMWDPRINPPISTSGEFIGDYQGLVADSCVAIPYYNNTHLANGRKRDPGFDRGDRRSRFQQLSSWRVKNRSRYAGTAEDRLIGSAGDDALCGFLGDDSLDGRAGRDILRGGGDADQLSGRTGDDKLLGGGDDDFIHGAGGKDQVVGGIGVDRINGGAGRNALRGGRGKDRINGGSFRDVLRGARGRDRMDGGSGEDFLRGGRGADRLIGGPGRDVCFGVRREDVMRSCEVVKR